MGAFDINDTECNDSDDTTFCIQTSESTIDGTARCGGACTGGDTLYIEQPRGWIKFSNFNGGGSYITITGDPSNRTVITLDGSHNAAVEFDTCDWIDFRGNQLSGHAWTKDCTNDSCYGIEIVVGATYEGDGIEFTGDSDTIKLQYLEIQHADGTGDNGAGVQYQWGGGTNTDVLDTFEVAYCYIHDTLYHGMYLGHNNSYANDDPYIANINVHDNLFENLGCHGFEIKGVWGSSGVNYITNNTIRPSDRASGHSTGNNAVNNQCRPAQGGLGLQNGFFTGGYYGSAYAVISGNWIERPNGACMSIDEADIQIYNNVMVGCGQGSEVTYATTYEKFQHGVTVAQDQDVGARPSRTVDINYNTFVDVQGYTYYSQSTGGDFAKIQYDDNIVADTVDGATGYEGGSPPDPVTIINTYSDTTGTASSMNFTTWVDNNDYSDDNFYITSSSPAKDAGGAGYPTDDYNGTIRPIGSIADIGAYEFLGDAYPPEDHGKTKILRGELR